MEEVSQENRGQVQEDSEAEGAENRETAENGETPQSTEENGKTAKNKKEVIPGVIYLSRKWSKITESAKIPHVRFIFCKFFAYLVKEVSIENKFFYFIN